MSTNDTAVTASDYAAGLRALADFLEAAGLPASVRFPTQSLGIQLNVTSADAVKDFALTHDLPVIETSHTRTVLALGPTPNTYRDGSIELTVVYVPDDPEDATAEEPEATGVDTYDCPEPGCDYNVSAVGTPDPDEPNEFAEDIEQHERGHAEAKERARLLAVAEECELGDNAEMARICRTAAYAIPAPVDEPVGALTAPPGVALVPPPALVRLDRDDAGRHVIAAALAFDELDDRREGLDVAGVDAWDTAREGLRQALADFREVNR